MKASSAELPPFSRWHCTYYPLVTHVSNYHFPWCSVFGMCTLLSLTINIHSILLFVFLAHIWSFSHQTLAIQTKSSDIMQTTLFNLSQIFSPFNPLWISFSTHFSYQSSTTIFSQPKLCPFLELIPSLLIISPST